MKSRGLLLIGLLLLPILLALTAVSSAAGEEPSSPAAGLLEQLSDETRPLSYRAQVVMRLLASRDAEARRGLARILQNPSRPRELRLAVITGALADPEAGLLPSVLDLVAAEGRSELGLRARDAFRIARSPALILALARLARDEEMEGSRRALAVTLMGETLSLDAVGPLIALWKEARDAVSVAARDALYLVVPVRFTGPGEAEKWWEANRGKSRERILTDLLREARGRKDHPKVARLLEQFARALLPDARLERVIDLYLGCRESEELRRLGAERLATYPFEEREKEGAEEARKKAAAALLGGLERETSIPVMVALLAAVKVLAPALDEDGRGRVLAAITHHLDSPEPEVRSAAVAALGEMRDPRAVRALSRRYDMLGSRNPAFRLEILDAIERIDDGIGQWIQDKLKVGDPSVEVVRRLILLLKKKYPKMLSSIPTLRELLRSHPEKAVREEAASAIGLIGVQVGDPAAVGALAELGLRDPERSVRFVAATQLGRAPEVTDQVIDLLRGRLGEGEADGGVRTAAALSLLKLRHAAAIPMVAGLLGEDAFWRATVRSYLVSDLLARGQVGEAVELVRALYEAGKPGRCAEAAGLVLAKKDLEWPPRVKGELAFLAARCLDARGDPAKALEAMRQVPGDVGGVERPLLLARLLRLTGAPARVAEVLAPVLALEKAPPGAKERARLELARADVALGRYAEAIEGVKSLLEDPKYGKQAAAIDREARAKRGPPAPAPADLVARLDGGDAAARKEAAAALKKLGPAAHAALLRWVSGKKPGDLAAALALVREITGIDVKYDPASGEGGREKVLEVLRKALGGK